MQQFNILIFNILSLEAVESYFKETHHLLGFFIWSIHIFLCYHPIYLIYIPHLAGFFFLLFHRLYLTKYKYSSKISFEQIETTILADSRVTSSPPARLALNNFSIFQNLNDMNTSTGEFLDTFDGIVNFIENWMNEPPVVTYSKWLALIFSFFALNILISLFHMTDIMAVGGTVLWLLSHWKIRNFVVAWTAVLAHEYSKSMVPSRSDMLRHESCRSTGRRASEGSSASLILTESTVISKYSVSERIKLFLFRIIHYFLSLRILDTVFHDPQQSIEDFDLDPSLFE